MRIEVEVGRADRARRLAGWLAYPGVMALGASLFAGAVGAGLAPLLAAYAAVAAGALLVTGLERVLPKRGAWRPEVSEVRADLAYMALVQGVLPLVLALTLARGAQRLIQELGLEPAALWPHAWPLVAQVVAMLLTADFLRYWLHVAAHRWPPLWRLHAVHHAPVRLYWLNVGRFHPAEKGLQYLLDALPFVLLGVGGDVLALYLVFYALNGFFQHSNVDLRYGLLNYVVSSAELHRWHHSRSADEASCNYGNNLIVWDLLFGTRFLPRDREVGELGIERPSPGARVAAAPHGAGPLPRSARARLDGLAFRAHMALLRLTSWRSLRAAARRPRGAQRELLSEIVRAGRATRFGREHGFAEISSYQDFRERVPLQTYETLRPYIDEQQRTGARALTKRPPVMYAQTSSTTGDPKLIPVLRRTLVEQRRQQRLFAYAAWRACPGAWSGKILGIVSPAVEGRLPSGAPFGSSSGHLYRTMPRLARARYVLPAEVFEVADYDLKYLLILRLACVERDVTALASANPSTFLKLLAVLRERRHELLADVETSSFSRARELPAHIQRAVAPRLACSRARLLELRSILARAAPTLADLWPGLALVTTWTGGSCGVALETLRTVLPPHTRIAELGYLASELRGTINVDPEAGLELPALRDAFFEFVERERWERGGREPRTLDQLELGRDYYVIVTTRAGLYRYAMNDIVRVTGRFGATPTLRFVQKGRGVTSITGEKLCESQVIEAVSGAARALGFRAPFFVALADVRAAAYRLLVEPAPCSRPDPARLAGVVDAQLRKLNLEYDQKRASGRLGALDARLLVEGSGEAYKRRCIARGQREGQFKAPLLQYADGFDLPVQDHLARGPR